MKLPTKYAPAERKQEKEIKAEHDMILSSGFYKELLDSLPNLGAILNEERQTVYANKDLLDFFGIESVVHILGDRPGEILGCLHSTLEQGGCGTSEYCRFCGAVKSIMKAQESGEKTTDECRICAEHNGTPVNYDLKITASPVILNRHKYTIITLSDISNDKRRRVLERIFFHDILNLSGSLRGMISLLQSDRQKFMKDDFLNAIALLSDQINDEILAQRQLLAAENNDLSVQYTDFSLRGFLQQLYASMKPWAENLGNKLHMDREIPEISVYSDRTLLHRVLVNTIKNAVEASERGDAINIGVQVKEGAVAFWVNNPMVMPDDVRLQIFQRSFSTKGGGRGIGTYSMKLLTEKYLHGEIHFTSTNPNGTTFYIEIQNSRGNQ